MNPKQMNTILIDAAAARFEAECEKARAMKDEWPVPSKKLTKLVAKAQTALNQAMAQAEPENLVLLVGKTLELRRVYGTSAGVRRLNELEKNFATLKKEINSFTATLLLKSLTQNVKDDIAKAVEAFITKINTL